VQVGNGPVQIRVRTAMFRQLHRTEPSGPPRLRAVSAPLSVARSTVGGHRSSA
jgi:hypothetical protein